VTQYIRVQELVGRRVRDGEGRVLGRIEGIRATWSGNRCMVEEFELGTGAFLSRLGIAHGNPRRVRWQDLDLSDPEHPRLRS
jgi:hypothetical protein